MAAGRAGSTKKSTERSSAHRWYRPGRPREATPISCTTLYLWRRAQGDWRVSVERYGDLPTASPEAARDHLLHPARRWVAGGEAVEAVGPHLCRGLLLDEPARRFRVYRCPGDTLVHLRAEALRRQLSTAAAWAGWDADHDRGGHASLAALAGLSRSPPPLRALEAAALDALRLRPVHGPGALDRAAWRLRYPDAERWEGGGWQASAALSLVHPDGRSETHALSADAPWAYLLAGPSLLSALDPRMACDPPYEHALRWGALFDQGPRALRWWSADPTPIGWAAAMAEAWPGWAISPEPDLYPGQLAAAGVDPGPLRIDRAPAGDSLRACLSPEEWALLDRDRLCPAPDRRPLSVCFAGG